MFVFSTLASTIKIPFTWCSSPEDNENYTTLKVNSSYPNCLTFRSVPNRTFTFLDLVCNLTPPPIFHS